MSYISNIIKDAESKGMLGWSIPGVKAGIEYVSAWNDSEKCVVVGRKNAIKMVFDTRMKWNLNGFNVVTPKYFEEPLFDDDKIYIIPQSRPQSKSPVIIVIHLK